MMRAMTRAAIGFALMPSMGVAAVEAQTAEDLVVSVSVQMTRTDGAEEPAVVASAVEFLLEGLHLARRINKERVAGGTVYHR